MTTALVDRLATAPRLLVATDFDGVLAPIVEDPTKSRPVTGSLQALRDLAAAPGTVVAVVSGRSYEELEQLVSPADSFELVGSHGAEMGAAARKGTSLGQSEEIALQRLVDALDRLAERYPGLHIEKKTLSAAVHLRRLHHHADRPAVVAGVELVAADWAGKTVAGKEVVEFTLRHVTKGDAVQQLASEHRVDATVYFGDDVTDEDVFVVLGPGDAGIKVGEGATAAGHRLAGPHEVVALLSGLAERRAAA